MMVDLNGSFREPLSRETLFRWHKMIVSGRRDVKEVGKYRTGKEPMQVVSGAVEKPRVHFEAPPSAKVPSQMERFFHWFAQTRTGGPQPLPALTRAGMAHLYFESIHPFEDGNGRIGRAIAEKSLAESLGEPTLTSLAATILVRRKGYYEALEAANKRNEITNWLAWFCRHCDRSTTPHDHVSRIPNRQNKAVRPSPRRVERKTDEGTFTDVPGRLRRISRRAKRRKVQHDYRRVARDDDT